MAGVIVSCIKFHVISIKIGTWRIGEITASKKCYDIYLEVKNFSMKKKNAELASVV